ncbi:DivIVA domain-containing protein [Sanguibacter sp. 25GB23B1]|uniref:DivIVA domain-containing protein n=1 Tax=unclassified Sanguibacter TaxID=2645534 RepID=UPI0032AFFF51
MLTADDVLTHTFPATKFRQGYDVLAVDDFLDRVIGALRYYETGGVQGSRMGADEVRAMKFPVTKFREGYDLDGVDSFLDEVEQCLLGLEAATAAGQQQPLRQYEHQHGHQHEEPAHYQQAATYSQPGYAQPQYAPVAAQQDTDLLPPLSPHAREDYPAQAALDLTSLVNALQRSYLLSAIPSDSTPIVLTPDGREYVVRAVTHESGQVVLEIG